MNRHPQEVSQKSRAAEFVPVHSHAAGIDIGARSPWVSVPLGQDEPSVREFSCYTPDLQALVAWLKQCEIETVAMESTGVYWIALFELLEAEGFEVILVHAQHLQYVPGGKSDVLDGQWIQQLHSDGLLSASFRPAEAMVVVRQYVRQRETLIADAARHVQRLQKALTQMNLHLHQVLSDLTGLSGMHILKAMVAGERNPQTLAALKHERVRSSEAEIAAALSGTYRAEHLFVLQQELALYESYQQQIAACDAQIETYLEPLPSPLPPEEQPQPKVPRKSWQNQPSFDLRTYLYRISGIDFCAVDGLGPLTVQTILSEVGLDPTRFGNQQRFASW